MKIKNMAFIVLVANTLLVPVHAEDLGTLSKLLDISDATLEEKVAERFAKADLNRDGNLTLDEAKNGMPRVAKNFLAIDSARKGYVSKDQIIAFALQKKAAYKAGKLK